MGYTFMVRIHEYANTAKRQGLAAMFWRNILGLHIRDVQHENVPSYVDGYSAI